MQKKKTLAEIDRGIKKGGFGRKHGLSASTQSNFLQDRQKIRSVDSDAV
jgi:hypothetical protein